MELIEQKTNGMVQSLEELKHEILIGLAPLFDLSGFERENNYLRHSKASKGKVSAAFEEIRRVLEREDQHAPSDQSAKSEQCPQCFKNGWRIESSAPDDTLVPWELPSDYINATSAVLARVS